MARSRTGEVRTEKFDQTSPDRVWMMSPRHHDVEYIPLDPGPGDPTNLTRRSTFVSAKYAGHLFLSTVLFAGILIGGGIGRWVAVPNVITSLVPSTVILNPFHYKPVVTVFDSFIDLCASMPVRQ